MSVHCTIDIMFDMLMEMREANKRLQEDFKRLHDKIDSEQCDQPAKKRRKKMSPSPEIRVSSRIMHVYTIIMYMYYDNIPEILCGFVIYMCVYPFLELCSQGVQSSW